MKGFKLQLWDEIWAREVPRLIASILANVPGSRAAVRFVDAAKQHSHK